MLPIPTSIHQLQADLMEGRYSAQELLLTYLRRIAALDSEEGGLNAVAAINPDALFLAEAADRQMAAGQNAGILSGVPILVKANIATSDSMPTTAGSLVLEHNYALRESFLVKRLRKAGAVILGKTNMTEFANFMSYRMPSGYSSLGGQVKNPHTPSKEPGGSSSGSAAAMAAQLAGACIGTETNSSILWPAQNNGVVGLKPSIGLVSRAGMIPISRTLDTAGPITACTEDAALVMNAIAGYDCNDPATYILKNQETEDFTRYLDTCYLQGRRIGLYHTETFLTDAEQQDATRRLVTLLRESGAELEDNCCLREYPEIKTLEKYEFKASLNYFFAKENGYTLRSILQANEAYGKAALRYGQDRMEESEIGCSGSLTEPIYLKAMLTRAEARRQVTALMDHKRLDAILCTGGITDIAPFTGLPSMTVPIGYRADRSPIGCCMMARHLDDARLLGVMYAIEKRIGFEPLNV